VLKAGPGLDGRARDGDDAPRPAAISGVSRFQLLPVSRVKWVRRPTRISCNEEQLARPVSWRGKSPVDAAASPLRGPEHLTRAFVRHFGITPARYRAAVA